MSCALFVSGQALFPYCQAVTAKETAACEQGLQDKPQPPLCPGGSNAATSTAIGTTAGSATGACTTSGSTPAGKVIYKPGEALTISSDQEDLVPTDDVELARKQVLAYPDSPEAAFILAVALSRTSMVEQALQEVRRARRLAEKHGGAQYFDKMIASYEKMLDYYPEDNRVRYGLAWAYYMKAYLLARYLKQPVAPQSAPQPVAKAPAVVPPQASLPVAPNAPSWMTQWATVALNGIATGNLATGQGIPGLPRMMDDAPPSSVPQIRIYYEKALKHLDDLHQRNPDDPWARAYRGFLRAEYSGDLEASMVEWRACRDKFPDNPAAYFFLGEGYLKQGNLKECLNNVSKAVALRTLGK